MRAADSVPSRPYDVAVVGLAGRFPGARDVEALWDLLVAGREGITRFADEELRANGVPADVLADEDYVRAGSVIDGIEEFDAAFFGLSPAEASILDPQHRLFLQHAWHAVEDAGHVPASFDGRIGVFAGCAMSTYLLNNLLPRQEVVEAFGEIQLGLANDKDSLATRVAHLLDLQGPAYTIQSYCSTSLVAVCAAATNLVQGECDLALAGGVAVNVPHRVGYLYQHGGMTSPDGRCRAFDASAEGTPVGSGVAVVALRRLDDALADGDHIYAVLRGWAVNNDGGLKVGFTAPGVRGQADVVLDALDAAGLEPADIDYVETHGTGTALGDAAELAALHRVFAGSPCRIGSVKTNLGHLDRAAGATGLIKAALALDRGVLPPTLNFSTPSPQLGMTDSFEVVTTPTPWPSGDRTRRAGVSAFGIGGTNAHVVLEEAPAAERRTSRRTHHVLAWSARTEDALDEATAALGAVLQDADPAPALRDVAFTLVTGRQTFEYRRALVADTVPEAAAAMADPARGGVMTRSETTSDRSVALMVAGVGEQYPAMVGRLYQTEPAFRRALDRCREIVEGLTEVDPIAPLLGERGSTGGGLDLRRLLDRGGAGDEEADAALARTEVLQPAMFVAHYALAATLGTWGLEPDVMIGYSLGEYVTACLAGVLSLEDALALVVHRARLINELPGGAMAAVAMAESAVRALIDRTALPLDVAGINGPQLTVVAGDRSSVDGFLARWELDSVASRKLETTHAFHSRALDPIAGPLTEWVVDNVDQHEPETPYISNVTGTLMTAADALDPAYWARHMRSTVRFADGLRTLLGHGDTTVVEIGPGQSLGAMLRTHPDCPRELWPFIVPTLPGAADGRPADRVLAEAVARLWLGGAPVDWNAYHDAHDARRTPLTRYPFQRTRHWIDAPAAAVLPARDAPAGGKETPSAVPPREEARPWLKTPTWRPCPSARVTGASLRHVVIVADHGGVATTVAERLQAEGVRVTVVDPAIDGRAALGEAIDAADRACAVDAVIHLRALDARTLADMAQQGARSAVAATAALGESRVASPRLLVVGAGGEAVVEGDLPAPEVALLAGPALAGPQEYPGLRTTLVDLPPQAGARWRDEAAAALVAELVQTDDEPVAAYRSGARYARTFETLGGSPAPPAAVAGGVYMITGGLGSVGLLVGRHLAEQGAAVIVVTSRTGPRTGDERLRELEALGTTVRVEAVDVADRVGMANLVDDIVGRYGRLDGVVHAAAVTSPDDFVALSALDAEDPHFRPKVEGVLALEAALAGREISFCLLFSSIATLLGGVGFSAYASANAFLDAVVYRNRAAGRPWTVVDWDTWAPTLQKLTGSLGATLEQHSLALTDALALFDAAAASGLPRLVAGVGDLHSRMRVWREDEPTAATPTVRQARPDLPQEFVPPADEGERRLARLWSETIGIDRVGVLDNFFDLGGTSLMGLQLLRRVKREFGVSVPAVALFEAPTVASLARYVATETDERKPLAPTPDSDCAVGTLGLHQAALASASDALRADGDPSDRAIAIIGMAGRFPGAGSVEELWQNLLDGVESIRFLTDEDLAQSRVGPEVLADPQYVRARPVLDDVRSFDAAFFGYSPREAALTDPQHRLFLECCWEGLEAAGYGATAGRDRVGVFGGTNISTYLLGILDRLEEETDVSDYQVVIGNDKDALATVVSYRLDLNGPSLAVQTFCSTSLVAVHLACRALQWGECEMALAGGVSVRVPDKVGHHYEPGGMESPDGHVRTFDAEARGSMFGDGCAVVVLKRLKDALRDGDSITAVIRGSAINNDGALKVGYTAPSVTGQAAVVTTALSDAGVDAEDVDFIEAHGTATELGDPIEVAALVRAFATERRQYCAIGSVKTNLGHLDRAAGVTGLIKAALALKHRELPASLHYISPNPEIDFERSPFFVNASRRGLERIDGKRLIAGVNSLGMGGTNAHVVLEEAPELQSRVVDPDARRAVVLPVSARSATAADEAARRLGEALARGDVDVRDAAWTLQVGRQRFEHRRAVVAVSTADAAAALAGEQAAEPVRARADAHRYRRVALLLGSAPGLRAGALAELWRREPSLRAALETVREAAVSAAGSDVVGFLTEPADAPGTPAAGPGEEVAAFLFAYAQAVVLESWGVRIQAVAGVDAGHEAAACVAGVLEVGSALKAVAERGRLRALAIGGELTSDEAAARFGRWVTENSVPAPTRIEFTHAAPFDPSQAASWAATFRGPGISDILQAARGPGIATAAVVVGDDAPSGQDDDFVVLAAPCAPVGTADDIVLARVLADLWLAGAAIDWQASATGVEGSPTWSPRRVPLPTYPFERSVHWIESRGRVRTAPGPLEIGTDGRKALSALPRLPEQEWLYLPSWRRTAFAEPDPEHAFECDVTLLLACDGQLGDRLAAGVRAALSDEAKVVVARPGVAFAATSDGYEIPPGSVDDSAALLRAVLGDRRNGLRVVHAWSVEGQVGPDDIEAEAGFHSIIALARAAGEVGLERWSLDVLVAGAHRLTPADGVVPVRAMATGPVRVVPLEYPGVRTRMVDLDGSDAAVDAAVREVLSPSTDQLVALRGGTRWSLGFERLSAAVDAVAADPFVDEGVYLVTGGLGGIGLALARRLGEHHRARLVLLGRTGLPAQSEWEALLSRPDLDGEMRRRLEGVSAIVAAGGEVEVVAGDVSSPGDVSRAVEVAIRRFGRLDGVLHAAAVPGVGLMQFKARSEAERVLAPKVAGTLALEEAVKGVDLDLLLLFSSITSVTGGGPGQVDYCAANAFLDAYALDAQARGVARRVIAVGWGEWTWNAWDSGLQGYDEALQAFFRANRERFGIGFDEGWRSLCRAAAANEPHLVVSTQDFSALSRLAALFTVEQVLADGETAAERHHRPELATPYVAPRTPTEETIASIWASSLGLEQVGIADNFFELGGNSLVGVNLVVRIRRALGLDQLAPHVLYEAPTVELLAALVDGGGVAGEGEASSRRNRTEMRRQSLERIRSRIDG